uniref:histidine--tRNA ligase n=1 Tax=Neogoniolithon spectabile TaxID=231755 RepID=A0A3G3MGP9_9FLOR|nr:histidine tRNA synthetase [Neogoniolithon spectabile]AYR05981.1 histidine tRNA synthetase [Neogoniolithon spectabile]
MQTIRGTKDILPSDIYKWQELYLKAIEIFNIYDYLEIKTPIVETTDLFLRSVGNNTDIVSKEMYIFSDRGGRALTLRPEGTAPIARAIINNKLYLDNNIQKLWYMGPMFRYERPQSGRQRQFHQLGIECIGSNSPLAEVEVITIIKQILDTLRCQDYQIEINSIGNKEERIQYTKDLVNYMSEFEYDLDVTVRKRLLNNPLRLLDSKDPKIQSILNKAPILIDYLGKKSLKHFTAVCKYLDDLNITYKINHKLVRGLDYYNDTTFEITSKKLGGQNTICGGGRYNELINSLGGPNLPGVGCAIGIERLMIIRDKIDKISNDKKRVHVIIQSHKENQKGLEIITKLRSANILFHLELEDINIQKQIQKAIKNKALCCIIIGENEILNRTVTIKWLKGKFQETVQEEKIIEYIKIKLSQIDRY